MSTTLSPYFPYYFILDSFFFLHRYLLFLYSFISFVLITTVETKVNARKEGSMRSPETGALMEVDVFVPHLHIGFEFQVLK